MEAIEYKKQIDLRLKIFFKSIKIDNYQIKTRNKRVDIFDTNNTAIADITYDYSSGKFIELGAIATLHLNAGIIGGKINNLITKLNLKSLINPKIGIPFYTNRYEFPKTSEYKGGADFSFYQAKNFDERIEFLINAIDNDIEPRMNNFLNYKLETIDDVFSKTDYYQYPAITILCILALNEKKKLIDDYLKMSKFKNLFDFKIVDKIMPQIMEI